MRFVLVVLPSPHLPPINSLRCQSSPRAAVPVATDSISLKTLRSDCCCCITSLHSLFLSLSLHVHASKDDETRRHIALVASVKANHILFSAIRFQQHQQQQKQIHKRVQLCFSFLFFFKFHALKTNATRCSYSYRHHHHYIIKERERERKGEI